MSLWHESKQLTQSNPRGYESWPLVVLAWYVCERCKTYVDVDFTKASSGCIVAARTGIVVDQRDDNASLASLVNDILEILGVRERLAVAEAVFVLGLVENDGSTVGDLSLGNNAADICHVAVFV